MKIALPVCSTFLVAGSATSAQSDFSYSLSATALERLERRLLLREQLSLLDLHRRDSFELYPCFPSHNVKRSIASDLDPLATTFHRRGAGASKVVTNVAEGVIDVAGHPAAQLAAAIGGPAAVIAAQYVKPEVGHALVASTAAAGVPIGTATAIKAWRKQLKEKHAQDNNRQASEAGHPTVSSSNPPPPPAAAARSHSSALAADSGEHRSTESHSGNSAGHSPGHFPAGSAASSLDRQASGSSAHSTGHSSYHSAVSSNGHPTDHAAGRSPARSISRSTGHPTAGNSAARRPPTPIRRKTMRRDLLERYFDDEADDLYWDDIWV